MKILYIITMLLLIILEIIVKKTDKKLKVLNSISVILVLNLCYNILVCYILDLLNIPITLLSLEIVNCILIAWLLIKILKDKQIQQYTINIKDVIFELLLLAIVISVGYLEFGFPIQIKYFSTDASMMHYDPSYKFYKSDKLLSAEEFKNVMPGLYINVGILFKVLSGLISEFYFYKILIIFDLFTLFMMGKMFYISINKYLKNKTEYVIGILFSTLYVIGYPLNNLLCGFFYLGLGVLIINTILYIMQTFDEKIVSHNQHMIALFLLNIGLFFSYYLFVPFVYGAIFIYYIIYKRKENEKILSKRTALFIVISLIIPFIFGLQFNVLQSMLSKSTELLKVNGIMKDEGYIYRNIFSNFILFIPFVIYYIYTLIKNKKIEFNEILLALLVLYIVALFIAWKFNIISAYYIFKNYFVLWMVIIYSFLRGAIYLINNEQDMKSLVIGFTMVYLIFLGISLNYKNVNIIKTPLNNSESIADVMDIYGINKTLLFDIKKDFTNEELEVVKYCYENLNMENGNAIVIGHERQLFWFYSITHYKLRENIQSFANTKDLEQWTSTEKEKYLIIFDNNNMYENYKTYLDKVLYGKTKIFSSNVGRIYVNK